MNNEEYARIIESAERLERSLFDLSSEENINRLEAILDEHSKLQGETIIGVPLVCPYGGFPVCEYISLPERIYKEMRTAMKTGKIGQVHKEIGVPYDKERLDINREQLRKGFRIPQEYLDFMERIRKTAKKVETYTKPAFSFYP